VYLRVREILALAADYSPSEPETQVFFQAVQNKLHFAATGKTAPELIAERADSAQPNMGLTAWKSGVVRKGDVTVAKNYLREAEIDALNRIVVMFLDFAEDQARRRRQIFLHTWQTRLDDFLRLNERAILPDAGKVSREQAHAVAELEYERFAACRRARRRRRNGGRHAPATGRRGEQVARNEEARATEAMNETGLWRMIGARCHGMDKAPDLKESRHGS
jgi:hypothetical protein